MDAQPPSTLNAQPSTSTNDRAKADYVSFGVIFLGFVLDAAAIIAGSVPAAIAGAMLQGAGLLYFLYCAPEADAGR